MLHKYESRWITSILHKFLFQFQVFPKYFCLQMEKWNLRRTFELVEIPITYYNILEKVKFLKGRWMTYICTSLHFKFRFYHKKQFFCSLWKFWKFQPSLNHFYKIEISNIRLWFALENIGCVTSNNVYRLFVSLVAGSVI